MEFEKYQHIEKLYTDEVEGILDGLCYIYPKIDGTNSQVWLDGDELHFGSRNRELSLDNDNAGFMSAMAPNLSLLFFLRKLPEGSHVYGEWLVPHSLKTYRDDVWRKFYIFDVMTPAGYLTPEDYIELADECCLDVIRPTHTINNPDVDRLLKIMEANTYLIKDGEGFGEGLVIKNYEFVNRYGRTTWAKLVTNNFKEKHVKEMGANSSIGKTVMEEEYVDKYLTDELIEKVYENIRVAEDGWKSRCIPRLIQTVYHDFVTEVIWQVIKDYKNPRIDFKLIFKYCTLKTKQVKEELF